MPPQTPLEAVVGAFGAEGLLVHLIDSRLSFYQRSLRATQLTDMVGDNDCGHHCMAFTLLTPGLPLVVFSAPDYQLGIGLLFKSSAHLWDTHVQCAAVTDSNTANRACCECGEDFGCPRGYTANHSAPYCHDACASVERECLASKCTDVGGDCCAPGDEAATCAYGYTPHWIGAKCLRFSEASYQCCRTAAAPAPLSCKQLEAGCSINLHNPKHQQGGCSHDNLLKGHCGVCRAGDWCAGSAPEWMRRYGEDWGFDPISQCKFKPQHREAFVEATWQYNRLTQEKSGTRARANENEVNMYLGPGDGGLREDLLDSLVGLFYSRKTGNRAQLAKLQALQDQFATLGKPLEIFSVDTEMPLRLDLWRPGEAVDLLAAPYNLRVQTERVDPADHPMNKWGEDLGCQGSGVPGCAPWRRK